MSLTFASEMLRLYSGRSFTTPGMTIWLLRPVRPGDTITFIGKVTAVAREPNGGRVTVEVTASNQKGDTTATGSGGCIVPTAAIPTEE